MVLGARHANLPTGCEIELLPPELHQVIQTPAEAAAIDPFERAPIRGELVEFFLGKRRPDLIAPLQVVERVMGDVVPDVPQAECRHRRQKGNASEDRVQASVLEKTAMTGIVTDQEEADDACRDQQRPQQLQPDARRGQNQCAATGEHAEVQNEHPERSPESGSLEGVEQGFAARYGGFHGRTIRELAECGRDRPLGQAGGPIV